MCRQCRPGITKGKPETRHGALQTGPRRPKVVPRQPPTAADCPQEADEDPGAWRGGAIPTPSRSPSHHGARLADVRRQRRSARPGGPQRKTSTLVPEAPLEEGGWGVDFVPRNALSESYCVSDRPSSQTLCGDRLADVQRERRGARQGGPPRKISTLAPAPPPEAVEWGVDLRRPSQRSFRDAPRQRSPARADPQGKPRSRCCSRSRPHCLSIARAQSFDSVTSRSVLASSHRNGARKPPWRGGLGGRPLNPKRE